MKGLLENGTEIVFVLAYNPSRSGVDALKPKFLSSGDLIQRPSFTMYAL